MATSYRIQDNIRVIVSVTGLLLAIVGLIVGAHFVSTRALGQEVADRKEMDATHTAQIEAAVVTTKALDTDMSTQMTRVERKIDKMYDLIVDFHTNGD